MEKQTLEQILAIQVKRRTESGAFGITECKREIKREAQYLRKSLYQLLETYVEQANKDVFFNKAMVLACWELINGR